MGMAVLVLQLPGCGSEAEAVRVAELLFRRPAEEFAVEVGRVGLCAPKLPQAGGPVGCRVYHARDLHRECRRCGRLLDGHGFCPDGRCRKLP
jgi:hypothetical protein